MNSRDRRLLDKVDCVRDLFASIFFTSLGLHVFPSFLAQQAGLLMLISIFIMGFKVIIAINTLHI